MVCGSRYSCSSNLGGLSLDIYIAHSLNQFRHDAEYVPLYFSLAAPWVLAIGLVAGRWQRTRIVWRDVGYLVGWLAVAIGLVGMILHLDSRLFYERTIESLVYAAPFAAPLSYVGSRFVIDHEPHGRPAQPGVGLVGHPDGLGRIRRQLRVHPDRPRTKRLLLSLGVDPCRQQRLCRWRADGALADRHWPTDIFGSARPCCSCRPSSACLAFFST